jgi:hypothetical protein
MYLTKIMCLSYAQIYLLNTCALESKLFTYLQVFCETCSQILNLLKNSIIRVTRPSILLFFEKKYSIKDLFKSEKLY